MLIKPTRFGLVEGTVIFVDDVGVEIDFYANFYQGSIIIHYIAQTKAPVPDDITFDFVNEVGVISGDSIDVEGTITIPKGAMSASTIVEIDDDYDRLSDDYVIRTANYTSNTKMTIKRNDFVNYEVPVKSMTADIPGNVVEDTSEAEPSTETPTTTQPDNNDNNNDNSGSGGEGGGGLSNDDNNNVDNFKVYYGKSTKIGVEETDITNLEYKLTTQIVNSHIELSEGNGYGFIIIPASMNQPSMFRNSEDGCNGFAIPMIDQGSIDIGEIGDETSL